ncbi:hypothetical protein KP509_25G036400 [Ceratopteris richardii]|uniref:Uncharacterized protein n=1 Tax=Ceratopteris richardii TaxID=49495 RepID=A0A8T2RQC0_CERRI|nr:hypothetical protein KP509_25G036400 [Ceratopteris richardii]
MRERERERERERFGYCRAQRTSSGNREIAHDRERREPKKEREMNRPSSFPFDGRYVCNPTRERERERGSNYE